MAQKKYIILGTVVILYAIYIAWLDYDFEPIEFNFKKPPSFTGKLAPNNALTGAEILLKGEVQAPEALVKEGNVIYTGTGDGKYLKIVDGKIEKVFGHGPGSCFGLRRLNKTHFVGADMYVGLLLINYDLGTVEDLVPVGEDFNGLTITNANDFDIIDQNVIIFTESSHRWSVSQFGYMFVEHIFNGRVLKYDIAKNKLELILDGLYFPNGFLIHPDGKSFLVGEFGASRITRFYLSGPKKGKKEFFAENLPGYSDNIRLSSHGTIYVAMAAVRDPDQQSYMEKSASYPQFRKVLLQVVPEIFLKLWTLLQIGVIGVTRGLVLEYDYNGTLLRSLQDPTGGVNHFSHVEDDGTHLYLGSYINDFIAKVSIKKIEEELNVKF